MYALQSALFVPGLFYPFPWLDKDVDILEADGVPGRIPCRQVEEGDLSLVLGVFAHD